MDRFDRVIESFSELAVIISGLMMILSAMYVSTELLARKLFNISFVGANEISGYVLAIGTAWAFSYCVLKRAHIRIDVFYRYLPASVRAGIDIFAITALTGLGGILVWYGSKTLFFSWNKGVISITTLEMPLWVPMLVWDIGLIFFFIVSLYLTVTSFLAFMRGEMAAVQARVGAVSGDEEVEIAIEEHTEMISNIENE